MSTFADPLPQSYRPARRAASLRQAVTARFQRRLQALGQWLEHSARLRASAHLLSLANQRAATQPELARALRSLASSEGHSAQR